MARIFSSTSKFLKPVSIFTVLLLIIFTIETLMMFFLSFVPPDIPGFVRNLVDPLFLAVLSAPFIWLLVVRPLRVAAESELTRTRATLENIVDAVINFDENGTIESLNTPAEKMFGYAYGEVIGRNISRIIPDFVSDNCTSFVSGTSKDHCEAFRVRSETTGCRRDGTCFPIEISSSPLHIAGRSTFIAIIQDITERMQYKKQLEYQANHDEVTGLPNRNLLTDRINQALLLSRRNHHQTAVIFADLDHFKFVNDSLGHDSGDEILKIVARRLTGCIRAGDTVARRGGDEFVVVISDPSTTDNAARIAVEIQRAVSRPLTINEHELVITCSMGISIFPRDGEDANTLMRYADAAMFRAKEMGRDNVQFFAEEMNAMSLARMNMEKHLRRALEKNELSLHYQPKVSLRSGLVTGMEVLVRWRSPELGMVSPGTFIPLAEETGLIEPIGEWVLATACARNKAWQDEGLPPMAIAVNISARQFAQTHIIDDIERILRESGLDPQYLELEITESVVMRNSERGTAILNALKAMGIRLTMDDFGTGYSSLGYLKRFPFDKLKVDQSFVRDITSNPDSAAIAKTVIAMAHSLHLKVIAEGVETKGQLNYLRVLDCDEMQGYYFSRPVPAAEFGKLLGTGCRLDLGAGDGVDWENNVLVVDDDENTAAALKLMLRLDGYRVLTAGSAREGFELLAENRIPVVISDLCMPVMNGSDFLGRVRELYPDTVRILISGHGDLPSVTDAVNHGAIFKFLRKPWDEEFVRDKINEAFRHYKSLHVGRGAEIKHPFRPDELCGPPGFLFNPEEAGYEFCRGIAD